MLDLRQYGRMIGKLIYLTVICRDIVFAVSLLSKFMHEPKMVHWRKALRVLAYIKGVPCKGFVYRKNNHLKIEAYSDFAYAGDRGDMLEAT